MPRRQSGRIPLYSLPKARVSSIRNLGARNFLLTLRSPEQARLIQPGQFVMVKCAEEEGRIKPGDTLVESTSGNTGLGLAMTAAVKGYKCVFTMPDKMSKEKVDMLKAYGAEVVITRTDLDHDHPDSYVQVAKRIARETPGGFYTDQYYNMANPEAHYLTTGPEIWEKTEGQIDCLVGGIGTGGTMSGAGRYVKEQAAKVGREVRVVCPDPEGSIYRDMFYRGEHDEPSIYRVEGIGHDFMVGTLDFSVIDDVRNVSDRDSFLTARRLGSIPRDLVHPLHTQVTRLSHAHMVNVFAGPWERDSTATGVHALQELEQVTVRG